MACWGNLIHKYCANFVNWFSYFIADLFDIFSCMGGWKAQNWVWAPLHSHIHNFTCQCLHSDIFYRNKFKWTYFPFHFLLSLSSIPHQYCYLPSNVFSQVKLIEFSTIICLMYTVLCHQPQGFFCVVFEVWCILYLSF